ncbi:MAG: hypothetical protein NVS9B15_23430 [Acidobacteriaceae bacterium]
MSTTTFSYNRTHSVTFMADSMRNVLREVIRESGLSPEKLMDDWDDITRGMRTWIESGHLEKIVIEFYKPGASSVSARWDFPMIYSGSGPDDDMWLDKNYLRQIIAKAARPSAQDAYRVLLKLAPGSPDVNGFSFVPFLSTSQLTSYSGGTVVATGHLTASATYWR